MAEFRVTDYGATGDGTTNDTSAFQAVAEAVNNAGGGTIVIPTGVYAVGRQIFAGESGKGYAYNGESILCIKDCAGEVIIRGEPAGGILPRLRAADGLRFGSFDPLTGDAYSPPPGEFTDSNYRADAYRGMIELLDNQTVVVQDLELDGNAQGLLLGGRYGDTGWQLGATGILAMQCHRVEVRNVHTHHHGQDGLMFGYPGLTPGAAETPHLLEDVNSEYNGRQGLSWIGGIGLTAVRCKFNYSGRGGIASAPGAGVDVEAERSVCRKGRFVDCEFLDNEGLAFVADNGDTEDVRLLRCRFLGTTAYAVWPNKPRIVFEDCEIYGTVVATYGNRDDPTRATQFLRCHFEDRTCLPGRPVYRGAAVIEANGENVLYDGCTVVGNETRALWIDEPANREIIRNTVVIHRAPNPPEKFQSLIRGAVLENVEFREEIPEGAAGPWYITVAEVEIRGAIWVQGPQVHWEGFAGPTGVIAGATRTGCWTALGPWKWVKFRRSNGD